MSQRTDYPAGAPCWVDALQPDPKAAATFWAELFGWHLAERTGSDSGPSYYVGQLQDSEVAGVGRAPATEISPHWKTYVRVDDIDATIAAAIQAGGRLIDDSLPSVEGDQRALLADPAGAVFGINQRLGAQRVNEPGAWSMSMLNTGDARTATDFYGALFGWTTSTFDAGGVDMTMWHLPGYFGGEPSQPVPRDVVAVMAPLPDSNAPARWDVNFWVRDADDIAARAEALGGSVIAPPSDQPPFREAVIADPAGAPIAISQLVLAT
jgi:predicted enzyme related to lactoylglutathione lyase